MGKRHKRRGSVLVELALVAPLAIALLLGGVHFGYLFYLYNLLDKSVRDGARYAASRTYTDKAHYDPVIQNIVVNGSVGAATPVVPLLTTAMVTVTEILPAGGGRPERIKIAITGYTYTGPLSSILGGTLTLNGKPSMEVPFIGLYMPPL